MVVPVRALLVLLALAACASPTETARAARVIIAFSLDDSTFTETDTGVGCVRVARLPVQRDRHALELSVTIASAPTLCDALGTPRMP